MSYGEGEMNGADIVILKRVQISTFLFISGTMNKEANNARLECKCVCVLLYNNRQEANI